MIVDFGMFQTIGETFLGDLSNMVSGTSSPFIGSSLLTLVAGSGTRHDDRRSGLQQRRREGERQRPFVCDNLQCHLMVGDAIKGRKGAEDAPMMVVDMVVFSLNIVSGMTPNFLCSRFLKALNADSATTGGFLQGKRFPDMEVSGASIPLGVEGTRGPETRRAAAGGEERAWE